MKHLLPLLLLGGLLATACVPKNQYDAVVVERNFYQKQATNADSLAELASLTAYDEVDVTATNLDSRIQEVESLSATNRALNESYLSLKSRYDELLEQNQKLLSNSGTAVSDLQQSLAERTAEVSRRESELRQAELDLQSRASYAGARSGDSPDEQPAQYGTVGGVSPLSFTQNEALIVNSIQNEMAQMLAPLPRNSYVMAPAGPGRLQITLTEPILFSDGYTVSAQGQRLMRQMATSLRGYPQAEVTVVSHADSGDGNPLRAFENSTDKAINVAQQLLNFGINSAKVTAGGKGFNDPVADNGTELGRTANRRTDFFISVQ